MRSSPSNAGGGVPSVGATTNAEAIRIGPRTIQRFGANETGGPRGESDGCP